MNYTRFIFASCHGVLLCLLKRTTLFFLELKFFLHGRRRLAEKIAKSNGVAAPIAPTPFESVAGGFQFFKLIVSNDGRSPTDILRR